MRVRVLYFASFREAAGRDEEERELPDGSDVAALWRQLAAEVPLFAKLPRPAPAAVNREHSPATTVLRPGDEVAFLPPVAGG
jgi:molybdopterin converting factor subunit 1